MDSMKADDAAAHVPLDKTLSPIRIENVKHKIFKTTNSVHSPESDHRIEVVWTQSPADAQNAVLNQSKLVSLFIKTSFTKQ